MLGKCFSRFQSSYLVIVSQDGFMDRNGFMLDPAGRFPDKNKEIIGKKTP